MPGVKTGDYLLTVTSVGYATYYTHSLHITAAQPALRLNDIQLRKETSILKEVTATGKRPIIEIRPDKTVVNVDASVTNYGATALEVLEKSISP